MIFYHENFRIDSVPLGPISLDFSWVIFFVGIFVLRQLFLESFRAGNFSIVDKKSSLLINYPKVVFKIVLWGAVGLQLGGRLWYGLSHQQPQVFMSFLTAGFEGVSLRGAIIGATLGAGLAARRLSLDFYKVSDILAFVAPTFIFLARLWEFLVHPAPGLVTNSFFGVVYAGYGEMARHPIRLYQALLSGAAIQIILFLCKQDLKRAGRMTAYFLMMYVFSEEVMAQFRDPTTMPIVTFGFVTLRHIVALSALSVSFFLLSRKTEELEEDKQAA